MDRREESLDSPMSESAALILFDPKEPNVTHPQPAYATRLRIHRLGHDRNDSFPLGTHNRCLKIAVVGTVLLERIHQRSKLPPSDLSKPTAHPLAHPVWPQSALPCRDHVQGIKNRRLPHCSLSFNTMPNAERKPVGESTGCATFRPSTLCRIIPLSSPP